jgi:hypothetical protein
MEILYTLPVLLGKVSILICPRILLFHSIFWSLGWTLQCVPVPYVGLEGHRITAKLTAL